MAAVESDISMTRLEAMCELSVKLDTDGVQENIDLINKIFDYVETIKVIEPTSAMNDSVLYNLMMDSLQSDYGYEMLDAEAWVKNNGGCVVSDMWDAYSEYINDNAEYKNEGI